MVSPLFQVRRSPRRRKRQLRRRPDSPQNQVSPTTSLRHKLCLGQLVSRCRRSMVSSLFRVRRSPRRRKRPPRRRPDSQQNQVSPTTSLRHKLCLGPLVSRCRRSMVSPLFRVRRSPRRRKRPPRRRPDSQQNQVSPTTSLRRRLCLGQLISRCRRSTGRRLFRRNLSLGKANRLSLRTLPGNNPQGRARYPRKICQNLNRP